MYIVGKTTLTGIAMKCVAQCIVFTFLQALVLQEVKCDGNISATEIVTMEHTNVSWYREENSTQQSFFNTSSSERMYDDAGLKMSVAHCTDADDEATELAPDSAECLYQTLFRGYNTNVRPVQNSSLPVTVNVKLDLKAVDKLELKTQKELIRMVLTLSWTDTHLAWDRHRYSNTSRLTVAADKIWLPDLTVESMNGCFEFVKPADIGRAVVDHKGKVTVWPSVHTELGIDIHVSKYPFDTQNLSLLVGSWSYSAAEVEFKLVKDFDPLQLYQINVEWDMLSNSSIELQYLYEDKPFDRVGYQFTIRRRWLYFVMNVIGPVVLACLLNLLVFLLPAESNQRVTLAISIFLSLTIFLSQINNSLPKTSVGLSILVIYLCLQIVGSVMTIATSVLIIHIAKRALAFEEQSSTSTMLSLLCRTVVPNQVLNELKEGNDESPASESTTNKEATTTKESTANTKKSTSSYNDDANVIDDAEPASPFKLQSSGSAFGRGGARKSQVFRRNIMLLASEYINTVCMWLSVIWNIVLLIVLVIVGLVE